MFKKFICILIFISVLTVPHLSFTMNTQALWRSALLPGWGQYFKQDTPKAYFIGGGFVLCLGITYFTYANAESKYDDYSNATSDFDSKWSDFESAESLNTYSWYAVLTVYLYNLVDAAFLGNPSDVSSFNNSPINLKLAYNNTKIEYSYKF